MYSNDHALSLLAVNCSSAVEIRKTNFPPEDTSLSLTEYRAASGPFTFTCHVEGATPDSEYRWSSTCNGCPFARARSASVNRTALLSTDDGNHTCTVIVPNIKCGTASIQMNIVGKWTIIQRTPERYKMVTLLMQTAYC